ncbi:hypothetical protein Hesat_gp5c [Staphylococcus phage Hesat]|nr:hypothetical protein Hesat_gp5c [Staphylococcus phage Hesat]DAZ64631.1 MAG TPA: hypothetical protein [Caudoviricetes sp.]
MSPPAYKTNYTRYVYLSQHKSLLFVYFFVEYQK